MDKFKLALTFVSKLGEGKKNFDGIDLTGSRLENLVAYEGSSLKKGIFQGCQLQSAILTGCLLKSAIFNDADMQGAVITGSDCQRTSFQGANLSRANFSRSRLLQANLQQANLQGANLQQTDVRGADFRGANLSQVEFRGAFYDDSTIFDTDIKPGRLGLRKVRPEESVTTASASTSRTKVQPQAKEILYRGARVNTSEEYLESTRVTSPCQAKEILYRGAAVSQPTGSTALTLPPSSQKKELLYRGVRVDRSDVSVVPPKSEGAQVHVMQTQNEIGMGGFLSKIRKFLMNARR